MTADLLFSWLHRFDSYIGRTPNCKLILLIDNFPAHGTCYTLPPLLHTRVNFLPPNTTSKLQPCDEVIIAPMKVKYITFQMELSLALAEGNSIYI